MAKLLEYNLHIGAGGRTHGVTATGSWLAPCVLIMENRMLQKGIDRAVLVSVSMLLGLAVFVLKWRPKPKVGE